jgi:malate dehydrogenase (oxaloacetate-decarboxylating)
VSIAALTVAANRTGVDIHKAVIGQIGLGAAGNAIGKMIMRLSGNPVLGVDMSEEAMARFERAGGRKSSLEAIMSGCDIVIATTGVPGLIKPAMIRKGQIIFALSNPNAEIDPEVALAHGAAFAADGKSVNNVLGFPIFRGALVAPARITGDVTLNSRSTRAHAPAGDAQPAR